MVLRSRFLVVLLSFSLLPLVAHSQTGQGAAGTAGATGVTGTAGLVGVSAPSLSAPPTSSGNQGVRQAPGTSPTGTAPTATDPRAPGRRTGTSAEGQASQRRQIQSGSSDTAALPQLERNEFQTFIAQSTGRVGTISVSGIKIQDLQGYVRSAIARNFRNFELSVSLGRLRSIQIFIVGQARRPGSYTVSSLSTLVSAVFASGGPSGTGSIDLNCTRSPFRSSRPIIA